MVRLADIDERMAKSLLDMPMPAFESHAWTKAVPLREARVAIVSTAGLHRRSDTVFGPGSSDYRLIPGDVDPAEIVMSHVSVNFDRSGFQQDLNVVFPLAHLQAMAAEGEIGSVAAWHYSFMGATDPTRMAEHGATVGRLLKEDGVTAALLVPV
jgi:D-proline reductase (dithiol) PrdB